METQTKSSLKKEWSPVRVVFSSSSDSLTQKQTKNSLKKEWFPVMLGCSSSLPV